MSEKHVAVLVFPFSSHPGVVFCLICRLAAAAPAVTFSFYSTAKSNKSLFSVPVPENVKQFDVPDGVPEGHVFSGKPQEEINLFLEVAEEGFKTSMAAAEVEIGQRIGYVIADAFLWFTAEVAAEMGAAWMPIWISGARSLSTHFYTDLIRDTIGTQDVAGRENEILKFIPGISELPLGDLQSGILFGNLQSPFSIMLHKMGQVLHKATTVLINSFEQLDPELHKHFHSKFRNFFTIGPINVASSSPSSNLDDPYGCISWLEKHRAASVAYIAFGTVATTQANEIAALAEGLETSEIPFLWSMKEKSKEILPEGFMERVGEKGKIVLWAPQVQVLAHGAVGVYITHCGWNSVLESIMAGVPMIGRPFLADNPLIAYMVENEWKIGVRVEGGVFTKSGTMSALEVVLKTEKGKKLKGQIEHYKELALKAVEHEGSSTHNFNTLVEVITGINN